MFLNWRWVVIYENRLRKRGKCWSVIHVFEPIPASWRCSSWLHLCHWSFGHSWWGHQMETFSALLAICAGNSPVPGKFPTQRPVTRSFDVFFDLRLSTRLSKQSWGWWFETPSRPLWRHRNVSYHPDGVSGVWLTDQRICLTICQNMIYCPRYDMIIRIYRHLRYSKWLWNRNVT